MTQNKWGRTKGAIGIFKKFKSVEEGVELACHAFLDHFWGHSPGIGGKAWGFIAKSLKPLLKTQSLEETIQAIDFILHLHHCGAAFFCARFENCLNIDSSMVNRILNTKVRSTPCCMKLLYELAIPELHVTPAPNTSPNCIRNGITYQEKPYAVYGENRLLEKFNLSTQLIGECRKADASELTSCGLSSISERLQEQVDFELGLFTIKPRLFTSS